MKTVATSAASVLAVVALCASSCESSKLSQQNDGATGAAACDCRVDERNGFDAVLTMSWSCYCASTYGGGCTRTFAEWCDDVRQRIDHPACGLTVLRIMSPAGPIDDVYDQDRKLVGAAAASDSGTYQCPSDPTLTAHLMQAGQLPAASCEGAACGTCSSSGCADAGR